MVSVITVAPIAYAISVITPSTPTLPKPGTNVMITTSAGSNGMFFGKAAVQIVIADQNAASHAGITQSTIPVSIVAESIEGKKVASDTFDIPETVLGSGKFEFYLTHHDSMFVNGVGVHPINAFGIAHIASKNQTYQFNNYQGTGKLAPVITFGTGSELDTRTSLFQDVFFKIIYNDQQTLLFYQKTPSQLMLDRNTYSSNSIVHVFIVDQTANLNPTVPDKFTLNADDLRSLFSLSGGALDTSDNVVFTETGPNTALFEADLPIGDIIKATSKSLVLTLHDKADYNNIGSHENGNFTDFSSISFNIQDTDGKLNVPDPLTFRKGLRINLSDSDENKDSEVADNIRQRVNVTIDGGDSETIDMKETASNSGVFIIDNYNNVLKASFTNGTAKNNDGILEFTNHDLHNDILITYLDTHNIDSRPERFTTKLKLQTVPATITLPSSLGINDQYFVLSINDSNLNDNPTSGLSYTFTPIGNNPTSLVRGNTNFGGLAQIQLQILSEGEKNNTSTFFDGNRTFTLSETDKDTGIFETKIGVKDITNVLNRPLMVRVTYFDNAEMPRHIVSAVMNIVKSQS